MKAPKYSARPIVPSREELDKRQAPPKAQEFAKRLYRPIDDETDNLNHRERKIVSQTYNFLLGLSEQNAYKIMEDNVRYPDNFPLGEGRDAQLSMMQEMAFFLLQNNTSQFSQSEKTAAIYWKDFLRVSEYENVDLRKPEIDLSGFYKSTKGLLHYKAVLNFAVTKFAREITNSEPMSDATIKRYQRAMLTLLNQKHLLPGIRVNAMRKLNVNDQKLNRKKSIDMLPVDYQKRVFDGASEKYKPIFAVMSLTGCRPAELESGIKIQSRTTNEGKPFLILRINNAKIGGYRDIVHEIDNPYAEYLHQSKIEEVHAGGSALREYLRQNRSKWLDHDADKLSPYSWRYSQATSCALCNLPEDQAMAILGHIDKNTRAIYILRSSGVIGAAVPKLAKLYL